MRESAEQFVLELLTWADFQIESDVREEISSRYIGLYYLFRNTYASYLILFPRLRHEESSGISC